MTRDAWQCCTEASPWTPFDVLGSAYGEGLRRVDAVVEEMQRRSVTTLEQTTTAIDELARFNAGSFGVARELTEEWFKMLRGATRWAGFVLGPQRAE